MMKPSPAAKNPERLRAEAAGRRHERLAAFYLRLKGYRVLESRARTPLGEIDLVVRRGRVIVFVEVKARARNADEQVTHAAINRRRITRAAQYWQARHPAESGKDFRFDVIFLAQGRWPRHLINAFGAS
mgnify:CR=1 FL=1